MTGNELFKRAIDLCALNNGQDGAIIDTGDLAERAISLINQLLAENSVLDGRILKTEHKVLRITSLDEALGCSEILGCSVLPYGLAMLFMVGEDDALAGTLRQLYINAQEEAIKFGKPRAHPITEVYS